MGLKERYPHLATWKRYGWDKKKRRWKADFLPGKPLPAPDFEEEERYIAGYQDWLEEFGLSTSEIQQCVAQLKERPVTSEMKLWREDIIPKALITYFQIKRLQDSLEKGEVLRDEASQKLVDMFLPSARGGKWIPSEERRKKLRIAYREMLECLKEVRRRSEIRLSKAYSQKWTRGLSGKRFVVQSCVVAITSLRIPHFTLD